MKPRSRTPAFVAGTALILLTNAIALGGVAWNRSDVDSTLELTQRELQRPYTRIDDENSGLALRVDWRVAVGPADGGEPNYARSGGAPEWLDAAKMRSLGFELPPDDPLGYRRGRELSREVLLVLELAGPTYERVREAAGRADAEAAARAGADPENKEFQRRAKHAHEQRTQEERFASRLFVVDAGLDRAGLRANYPDRQRYAIVRGHIAPWRGLKEDPARGYVRQLAIDTINVPFAQRARLEQGVRQLPATPSSQSLPFVATVAFGQRLEPWITGISNAAD